MNRWIRSGSAIDPDLSRPPSAFGKRGQIERGPDTRRIVAIGPIQNADWTASDIHSNYPHSLQGHPCAGQPFQPGKDKIAACENRSARPRRSSPIAMTAGRLGGDTDATYSGQEPRITGK